ncbi:MAG TPA: hypothetical protein VEJ20_08225, partial [Candidatus Eremiobacteraceae bacterium]|nr:hypothetical protein [Candidatus Eremiobacteraceae bacterium]
MSSLDARRKVCLVLVSLCLIAAQGRPALADATTTTANGATYTDADAQQAVQAVLDSNNNHAFLLGLLSAPTAEMPTWAPIAYYAGPQKIPDGRTAYVVYIADKYQGSIGDLANQDHVVAAAIASAVFLAVMDAGLAGTQWKTWYDQAAAQDQEAGASAADPYAHRRALVANLADTQTVVYQSIGAGAPISDRAGNPLTEPIDYGTGLIGDARLGVGAARLTDLFDYPDALKERSTQTFIDDWFAHFSAVLSTADLRATLAQQRQLFVYGPTSDFQSAEKTFVAATLPLMNSLNTDERQSLFLGLTVSETR